MYIDFPITLGYARSMVDYHTRVLDTAKHPATRGLHRGERAKWRKVVRRLEVQEATKKSRKKAGG